MFTFGPLKVLWGFNKRVPASGSPHSLTQTFVLTVLHQGLQSLLKLFKTVDIQQNSVCCLHRSNMEVRSYAWSIRLHSCSSCCWFFCSSPSSLLVRAPCSSVLVLVQSDRLSSRVCRIAFSCGVRLPKKREEVHGEDEPDDGRLGVRHQKWHQTRSVTFPHTGPNS